MYIREITLKIACNYHLNRYLDCAAFKEDSTLQRKTEVKREPIGDLANPFNKRKLNQCGHCDYGDKGVDANVPSSWKRGRWRGFMGSSVR